jgi:hypothetical protein
MVTVWSVSKRGGEKGIVGLFERMEEGKGEEGPRV